MCCTSLRGAAYFGASIHITLGALLFIRYVIVTAFLTFFNVTDVIKDRITGYLLPFVAYITLFLAFGIVIFHSVEKEYFIILKWATLGFSLLQIAVLVALFILRFLPAYEYRQFPFLPVSITDGYVNSGFQSTDTGGPAGGPSSDLIPDDYSSEFLPKLTRSPGGIYPTSQSSGSSSSSSRGGSVSGKATSAEVVRVIGGVGGGGESGSDLNFIPPMPAAPPNKWLAEMYSLIALIIMTVVSLVYLIILFIYVRQLIYEDSGHVFGHAQSVTRNVAFYVQPQFAQSGNSDNKFTNSPSPAPRSKTMQNLQGQQATSNCTQPVSNTQIPSEFLPQPQNQLSHQQHQRHHSNPQQLQQQPPPPSHHVGNHLKTGSTVDSGGTQSKDPNLQSQAQSQNHIQRSPVPPARTVQQNIQTQQQQQVITIYPQKGGGYTSSSSSPRMQVKFAKPLEQQPNTSGVLTQPHAPCGDPHAPLEPPRSCLANPGNPQFNAQQPPPTPHSSMPPPQSQCQRDSGRGVPVPGQYQQPHPSQQMMQPCGSSTMPPPLPPHQSQQSYPPPLPPHQSQQSYPPPLPPHQSQQSYPPPLPPHQSQQHYPPPLPPHQGQQTYPPQSHIHGQQGQPYTHQQQQPPQHMPYHDKSRAHQQSYNDMVDNSSYLVFSGNPNTSNLAAAPHHPPHMASASHTYPHCSQRRPSGSMV